MKSVLLVMLFFGCSIIMLMHFVYSSINAVFRLFSKEGNGNPISMEEGRTWIPSVLKRIAVYSNFEGVQTIAEESTSFRWFQDQHLMEV
jgi:hypothetical protein